MRRSTMVAVLALALPLAASSAQSVDDNAVSRAGQGYTLASGSGYALASASAMTDARRSSVRHLGLRVA